MCYLTMHPTHFGYKIKNQKINWQTGIFYMYHPIDGIIHTMTFVIQAMEDWFEQDIIHWIQYEGLIRQPIAPWEKALPWSHVLLLWYNEDSDWLDCISLSLFTSNCDSRSLIFSFQPVLSFWYNKGVVAFKIALGCSLYRDVNPVPTSLLTDCPNLHHQSCLFYLFLIFYSATVVAKLEKTTSDLWYMKCISIVIHCHALPCCYSEKVTYMAAVGFLSRYLNGPLPYIRRHITINKMCCVCR